MRPAISSPQEATQLFYLVIRVPKDESAFTYFQLEANDGLCFYSTLDWPEGADYRDLELTGDIRLQPEIRHLVHTLQKQFDLQILKQEVMTDCYVK